jgi:endonuclease YncB( thermonuclease family)
MTKNILNIILLVILVSSTKAAPDEAGGVVIYVDDGDSFQVQMDKTDLRIREVVERVRLADVDSPPGETPTGKEAKEYTKAALLNSRIWLDIDDLSEDVRGPYGRLICMVYLENPNGSINISHPFNKILVDAGHAVVKHFDNNEFDPMVWWLSPASEFGPKLAPQTSPSPSVNVVINEVELNPSGYDEDEEWLELYNKGEDEAEIGCWILSTTSGAVVIISPRTTIPAKGFYVVTNQGYWLSNGDEEVVLRTDRRVEVDRTPALSDSRNDDLTWSRHPDGGEEWVYIESSRGSNVPPITHSEGTLSSTTGKAKNKDWLGCCGGGYFDVNPANRRMWDVSDFLS